MGYGELPRPDTPQAGPTLAGLVADVWGPRARRRLAPKTWERDAVVYRKHIRPELGDHPIAALDIEDLVIWQETLEANGVGEPTIAKAIGILSSIFREAARRPRLTGVKGNPVALLEKPPTKRRRRPLVWGPIVVERVRQELLVNSRRIGSTAGLAARRDALLVSLMAMTGCRPGEALALRWSDVGARIAIARRLSGKQIVGGTKGGRDRSVPVLAPLQADLSALRERAAIGPRTTSSARRPVVTGSRPTGATTARATSSRRCAESKRGGGHGGRRCPTRTRCAKASPVLPRPGPTTSAATPTRP